MKIPFRQFDVHGPKSDVGLIKAKAIGAALAATLRGGRIAVSCNRGEDLAPTLTQLMDGMVRKFATAIYVGEGPQDYLALAVGHDLFDGSVYVTLDDDENLTFRFSYEDGRPLPPDLLVELRALTDSYTIDDVTKPLHPKQLGTADMKNYSLNYRQHLTITMEELGDWPPTPNSKTFVIVDDGGTDYFDTYEAVMGGLDLPDQVVWRSIEEVVHSPILPCTDLYNTDRETRMAKAIQGTSAALGIMLNSDGTKLRAFDDKGRPLPHSCVATCLAAITAQRFPGCNIVSDYLHTLPVIQIAAAMDTGYAITEPGTYNIRHAMVENAMPFGMEADGTYYFKELWWNESATLAALMLTHFVHLYEGPISGCADDHARNNPYSEEQPIKVRNAAEAIEWMRDVLDTDKDMSLSFSGIGSALIAFSESTIVPFRFVVRPLTETTVGLTLEGHGRANLEFLNNMRSAVTTILKENPERVT